MNLRTLASSPWTYGGLAALPALAFSIAALVWEPVDSPALSLTPQHIPEDSKISVEPHVKALQTATDEFARTFTTLLALTALALYVLRTRRGEFDVPLLRVKVPLLWVQVALPAFLTFWVMSWGFQLHRMIDARVACTLLIQAAENLPANGAALRSVSRVHLLRDNGFGDLWFVAFHPPHHYISESSAWGLNRTILVLYGLVVAGAQAATFALFVNVVPLLPPGHWRTRVLAAYAGLCTLLIFAAYVSFYFFGPQENWLSFVILWSTPALFLALVHFARYADAPGPVPATP